MLIKNISDSWIKVMSSTWVEVLVKPLETVAVSEKYGRNYLTNYSSRRKKVEVATNPQVAETESVEQDSKERYKQELDAAGITYHPATGVKKLRTLYNENLA